MMDFVRKHFVAFSLCLYLLLTVTAFIPSLRNGFVNLDDGRLLCENPKIMQLSLRQVAEIFGSPHYYLYSPLSLLSYAVEFRLFRLSPLPYHVTNLFLHLCNGIMVFLLLRIVGGRRMPACIAAVLFGIHPLHVESVAWVSERKDVLYAFFFLAGLLSYVYFVSTRRFRYYAASFILYVLALLSKPTAVVFPLVLLLYDYFSRRDNGKRSFGEKLPFFIPAVFVALITLKGFYLVTPAHPVHACLRALFAIGYFIPFYMLKVLAPLHLSPVYPLLCWDGLLPPVPIFIASMVTLCLLCMVPVSLRCGKKLFFGMAFFFVALYPALHLSFSGLFYAADRYMYIPVIGLFYLLAEGFALLYDTLRAKAILCVALGAVMVLYAGMTWRQCRIWGDSARLWDTVLARYPLQARSATAAKSDDAILKKYPNLPVALKYRALACIERHEYDAAQEYFSRALELNPQYNEVVLLRGDLALLQERFDAAERDFARLAGDSQWRDSACTGLGVAADRRKERTAAVAWFTKALAINPRNASALYHRARLRYADRAYDAAERDLRQAVRIAPFLVEAHVLLGDISAAKNEYPAALAAYTSAIRLSPRHAEAYNNRGAVYAKSGNYTEARRDFEKALSCNRASIDAYCNLANVYGSTGNYPQAALHFGQALALNPRHGPALFGRGVSFFYQGEYRKARNDLLRAKQAGIVIDPELWRSVEQAMTANEDKSNTFRKRTGENTVF